MNIKKLEHKIQTITNDEHFKIRLGQEYDAVSIAFQTIIDNIAKLNDAIGNVEYVKKYYADLFNTRHKYMNFIANCEDISFLMEKRRREFIIQFIDFIEELCRNEELLEIMKDDFPNLIEVLEAIKEDKENLVGIYEIIDYLEKWIDIISYDEPDNYFIELLDEEFEDFYELYFGKK